MQSANNWVAPIIIIIMLSACLALYAVNVYHTAWSRYGRAYHNATPHVLWPEMEGRLLPADTCFGHRALTPLAILTISQRADEALLHKLGLSVRHLTNADRYLATTAPIADLQRLWKQCLYAKPLPTRDDYLRRFEPYYAYVLFLEYRHVLPYALSFYKGKKKETPPLLVLTPPEANTAAVLWPHATPQASNISEHVSSFALSLLHFDDFDPTAFWTACLPYPQRHALCWFWTFFLV